MSKKTILLVLIILLAFFLRFYNLEIIPPGIHTDEVLTEYTSYSLLKTGVDLIGKQELFRFADTNIGGTFPSLYSWILVPMTAVLGMNVFVDRLPSAVSGIISVLLFYYVANKLTKSYRVGLIAAFFLAINPTTIHYSRAGLLESLSLCLVLAGMALFLSARKKPIYYFFSSICYSLVLFTYDSSRLFLPLFVAGLIVLDLKYILKVKKTFIIAMSIFVLFFGFFIYQVLFSNEIGEYTRSSIIDMSSISQRVNEERTLTTAPLWLSSIFHNKLTVIYKTILTNYVSIFSVNWFYINGFGNFQQAVANHGQFYIFELPLAIIGFYYLFSRSRKLAFFLLYWMLIGVLPGGLSINNSVYRVNMFIPVPILFSSIGFVVLWDFLKKFSGWRLALARVAVLIIIISAVCSYCFTYFYDYPVYASESWAKQQNDAVKFLIGKEKDYGTIYVDGGDPWAMDYVYFKKINPKIFQYAYNNKETYKSVRVMKIDNFVFGNFGLDTKNDPSSFFPKGALVISNALNFPKKRLLRPIKIQAELGKFLKL